MRENKVFSSNSDEEREGSVLVSMSQRYCERSKGDFFCLAGDNF